MKPTRDPYLNLRPFSSLPVAEAARRSTGTSATLLPHREMPRLRNLAGLVNAILVALEILGPLTTGRRFLVDPKARGALAPLTPALASRGLDALALSLAHVTPLFVIGAIVVKRAAEPLNLLEARGGLAKKSDLTRINLGSAAVRAVSTILVGELGQAWSHMRDQMGGRCAAKAAVGRVFGIGNEAWPHGAIPISIGVFDEIGAALRLGRTVGFIDETVAVLVAGGSTKDVRRSRSASFCSTGTQRFALGQLPILAALGSVGAVSQAPGQGAWDETIDAVAVVVFKIGQAVTVFVLPGVITQFSAWPDCTLAGAPATIEAILDTLLATADPRSARAGRGDRWDALAVLVWCTVAVGVVSGDIAAVLASRSDEALANAPAPARLAGLNAVAAVAAGNGAGEDDEGACGRGRAGSLSAGAAHRRRGWIGGRRGGLGGLGAEGGLGG